MMAARLGKIPTTSVRRRISLLSFSSGLLDKVWRQTAGRLHHSHHPGTQGLVTCCRDYHIAHQSTSSLGSSHRFSWSRVKTTLALGSSNRTEWWPNCASMECP
jgi:hypothetical protein